MAKKQDRFDRHNERIKDKLADTGAYERKQRKQLKKITAAKNNAKSKDINLSPDFADYLKHFKPSIATVTKVNFSELKKQYLAVLEKWQKQTTNLVCDNKSVKFKYYVLFKELFGRPYTQKDIYQGLPAARQYGWDNQLLPAEYQKITPAALDEIYRYILARRDPPIIFFNSFISNSITIRYPLADTISLALKLPKDGDPMARYSEATKNQFTRYYIYLSESLVSGASLNAGYYKIRSIIEHFDSLTISCEIATEPSKLTDGDYYYKCKHLIWFSNKWVPELSSDDLIAGPVFYETPLPTMTELVEILDKGQRYQAASVEKLIELLAPDHFEDQEDDGIDASLVKITEVQKKQLFTVAIEAIIQEKRIYNNRYSNYFTIPQIGADMVKAILTPDKAAGCHDLEFSFGRGEFEQVKAVIAIFKATISANQRTYNPTTKIWSFADAVMPQIKQALRQLGVLIEERAPVSYDGFFYEHAVQESTGDSPATVAQKLAVILGITVTDMGAGIELKKIYRKKALELHPDRNNGDGSKMAELNSLWSAYNASV